MRHVPDEFLGALFGAWIGVATEIWTKPLQNVALFVGSLALLAILLDIASSPYNRFVRYVALVILILLAVTVGVVFTFTPGLKVFFDDSQLGFFYILLVIWLGTGIVSTLLSQRLAKYVVPIGGDNAIPTS